MKTLQTGENMPLGITRCSMAVSLSPSHMATQHVELLAFLVGASGKVEQAEDVIYAHRPNRTDQCVAYDKSTHRYTVDLTAVPAGVQRLFITLSIVSAYGEGVRLRDFQTLVIDVFDTHDAKLCTYPVDCQGRPERAIKLVELYRHKAQWKIRAQGVGYEMGLPALTAAFGTSEPDRVFGLETSIASESTVPGSTTPHTIDGERFSGTGFSVNQDGFIMTNYHVIEGTTHIEARSTRQKLILEPVFCDPRNDIALLRAEQKLDKVASFCGPHQVCAGEPVTAIGYPLRGVLGSGAQVTTGNVSSLVAPGDATHLLQFTAPIQSGNSGGPLFDRYGHIAGMVCAKLNAATIHEMTGDVPQNVNFAIKAYTLMMFLHALGINVDQVESRSQPQTPDVLAHAAAGYTFQILCR